MATPKKKKAKKKQQQKRRAKRKIVLLKNGAGPKRHEVQVDKTPISVPSLRAPEYKVLSDKTIVLGHKKAYEYCELPIFEGERKVEDPHVQTLWDRMTRGSFNFRLVVLATCKYNSVEYKINGQHTCWAVINKPSGFSAKVREIRFSVDTKDDLKSVYAMFDNHLPRTANHLTRLRLVNTDVTEDIHKSLISVLTSGIKFWLFESRAVRRRYRDEETAALAHKHKDVLRSVAFLLQENGDLISDVRRVPVVAAMMSSYSRRPEDFREFWQPVVDGANLTARRPRWALRKYLNETTLGAGIGAKKKKTVTPEVMFRVCIHAWNKWREGSDTRATLRPSQKRVKPK